MRIHPRISVNSLSSIRQSLPEDIAMWQALGARHVGTILQKIQALGFEAARDLIRKAELRVSTVFGPPAPIRLDTDPALGTRAAQQALIAETLEFAASVDAGSTYVCTGGMGSLTWEQAADAFCEAIAPSVELANRLGVPLAIEATNSFRCDVSFVFSLRDAADLARAAGLGVVLDVHACWHERGFAELVRANVDRLALVQINDFVVGTYDTPNRAVPGDGDIPLERLLGILLDAGYAGAFDLELLGPRIDREGYPAAIGRAIEHANGILDRLGA